MFSIKGSRRMSSRARGKSPTADSGSWLKSVLAVVVLAVPVAVAAQILLPPSGTQLPSFADLIERVRPSVVDVSITGTARRLVVPDLPPGSPFGDMFEEFLERYNRPRQIRAEGSGFIIDGRQGYVVTNHHVVDGADSIRITLHDGTELDGELVGQDDKTDVALLKVSHDQRLPQVEFGDSDKARVGDWAIAIGSPFSFDGTVTVGIISGRSRNIESGPYDDFIQTDASLNQGNSGGPLFNLAGEVIGINTAIYSPSGGSVGIGFAWPSNLVRPIIDQLRRTGSVQRGWLGVRIQQVTEAIARGMGLAEAQGALVSDVVENSPAARAGIQQGDVIMLFGGQQVQDTQSLQRLVANSPVGEEVEIVVWRKRQRVPIRLELGLLEETRPSTSTGSSPQADPQSYNFTGMALGPVTRAAQRRLELPTNRGALVTAVEPGSPAASAGIRREDLILQVSEEDAVSPSRVEQLLRQAQRRGADFAVMLIWRTGGHLYVSVEILDRGSSRGGR